MTLLELVKAHFGDKLYRLGFQTFIYKEGSFDRKAGHMQEYVFAKNRNLSLCILREDGEINAKIGKKGEELRYVNSYGQPNRAIKELLESSPENFATDEQMCTALFPKINRAVQILEWTKTS